MKTTTSTVGNSIDDSLLRYASILMLFVLMCVATLPGARAFSPAPDGGCPNGNTAEGQDAYLHLTKGIFYTAIGFSAHARHLYSGVRLATAKTTIQQTQS